MYLYSVSKNKRLLTKVLFKFQELRIPYCDTNTTKFVSGGIRRTRHFYFIQNNWIQVVVSMIRAGYRLSIDASLRSINLTQKKNTVSWCWKKFVIFPFLRYHVEKSVSFREQRMNNDVYSCFPVGKPTGQQEHSHVFSGEGTFLFW